MTGKYFVELLEEIKNGRYEKKYMELECTEKECVRSFFDSLSSFSNQDEGGS